MTLSEAEQIAPIISPSILAKIDLPKNRFARPDNEQLIIQRVSFIGAVYSEEKGLFWRDVFWLKKSLEACMEAGLYIANPLIITPLGLKEKPEDPGEERDFLDPLYASIPADLALFGLVYNQQSRTAKTMCANASGAGCRQSPHHHKKERWPTSLALSQAKIAITFHDLLNPEEIRAKDLVGPSYVTGNTSNFQATYLGGGTFWVKLETLLRKDLPQASEPKTVYHPVTRAHTITP